MLDMMFAQWRTMQTDATSRGGTPIHKLYGDVPPFRLWFFDRPLINKVFSKIFYKQGLKIIHLMKK